MVSKVFNRRLFFLIIFTVISPFSYAQQGVTIRLIIINRQAPTTDQEAGLLIDVKNQSSQDVALFTPLGDLLRYISYYKLNPLSQQYEEIKHPFYQQLDREDALKDSLWKASKVLVHFNESSHYNWKSALYRQFINDDSLWYDHSYRSTTEYEKTIQDTDIQRFRRITNTTEEPALFTMMKAKERFQDFMNISFLYEQKGDYKIVLKLPDLKLHQLTCLVGNFLVKEPGEVISNEIYLSIR